ncbi:hypothetical protein A3D78_01050 [Candidatus Gottesmanbacteria bacterium RIFCSPHIGHO2_02_FULL_39_14]|uniref:Methyltransferase type 11 domain-containing protein n=3 Tax=Candidatus Gottesmaniibacteriota TaxID=1752720 RepID=A0A1F6A169_9BACT|nr:MAG: hypothetical protein A2153_05300 [Candidatus Gottesmanbacteria bacterium RBG_16_38_7b]OGG18067.1 MAG: hypothetical protein A3D78_01050 [Candidatus Gottesmanbacteria bacterium RIFCSPHIGHO2_02_FULL_39_14]OGG30994.1 MAG: hypothetical protein A3I51_03675 [Candidatus Gottesmanbacteria bacterium RIFCSPLOWO2_02_FULL_38_8]
MVNKSKRINPPFWQHDFFVLKRLYGLLKIIANYIPPNSIIIDYGCGNAPYENLFNIRPNRYLKVDIGKNKIADIHIKEDMPLPLKNNFADVILSTQVLEHVNNVDLYLRECQRILKKKGSLILSTHGLWPFHPSPGDFQRFTAPGLKLLIKKYDFRTLKFFPILGPFASVTEYTLLLLANRLAGKNILGRLILAVFSLVGNLIIFIEDKFWPVSKNSDASLYLIWAEKK